ncbi:hypothetical protein B0H19DRAFT_1077948 [Mycena capillaripes]|nr:hypothetical protein B0H19DRAFT_1077948 [Mycena capillaripes]
MNINVFIYLQQLEEIEMDEVTVDEEQQLAGSAVAIISLGAIEAHWLRTERRQPSRLYLCRPPREEVEVPAKRERKENYVRDFCDTQPNPANGLAESRQMCLFSMMYN